MGRFIVRRLMGMILVLFAISIIVFLIFNVIPNSDPAQRMAGKNATPALVESINKDWGFEDPLPQQYLTMMKKIFSGELISYSNQLNVNEQISKGLPATFSLSIGAAVIWMFFGVIFGYLSAMRAGGATDRLLTVLAMVGISMPVFVLAAVFLKYLAYDTGIFPSGGYVKLTEEPTRMGLPPDPSLGDAGDHLRRLLQPRAALQHARRDERRLRPHRAGQGTDRAHR